MSSFGIYKGQDFLDLKLPERVWMVENLIRELDSVILCGNEKSGKSLFIFQLVHALTSGQEFLDHYKVTKNYKVVYIQLEGELNDSQDRMKRMMKTQELHPENFLLMFFPPLEMQDNTYRIKLQDTIKEKWNGEKPDLVIFDPLYFCFTGSLSDDEVVRKFIGNLRSFKEVLNCAIILVHHTHKQKWTSDGFTIDEGDGALFGSKFFSAWADHILMFLYDKKRDVRVLSCSTQRSGNIVKECALKLIEPDPLYFEITQEHTIPLKDFAIVDLLKQEAHRGGMTRESIQNCLSINPTMFYKSIKKPLIEGIIIRSPNRRPILFSYNTELKGPIVEEEKELL
jgi:hypothetical protein